jgi:hypothetical protein
MYFKSHHQEEPEGLRLESELPRSLPAQSFPPATGNQSRNSMDVEGSVRFIGGATRRGPGRFLPLRESNQPT